MGLTKLRFLRYASQGGKALETFPLTPSSNWKNDAMYAENKLRQVRSMDSWVIPLWQMLILPYTLSSRMGKQDLARIPHMAQQPVLYPYVLRRTSAGRWIVIKTSFAELHSKLEKATRTCSAILHCRRVWSLESAATLPRDIFRRRLAIDPACYGWAITRQQVLRCLGKQRLHRRKRLWQQQAWLKCSNLRGRIHFEKLLERYIKQLPPEQRMGDNVTPSGNRIRRRREDIIRAYWSSWRRGHSQTRHSASSLQIWRSFLDYAIPRSETDLSGTRHTF